MIVKDLKIIDYKKCWDYQLDLFNSVIQEKESKTLSENYLLLCEHPHTITIGKHGKFDNLLYNESFLKERNIDFYAIDRGGDITYHGPGQLVGYPITNLELFNIGLKQYIYNLEETIIRLLAIYNIKGERLSNATGVWIDVNIPEKIRKIAAIGVKSSRFVTMHGFALNVNTDLSYFTYINPCGFTDKGVTSMEQELGRKEDIREIKMNITKIFTDIFLIKK